MCVCVCVCVGVCAWVCGWVWVCVLIPSSLLPISALVTPTHPHPDPFYLRTRRARSSSSQFYILTFSHPVIPPVTHPSHRHPLTYTPSESSRVQRTPPTRVEEVLVVLTRIVEQHGREVQAVVHV